MKKLTKAEEEIMLILWKLDEAVVRDVISQLKDPETPYTTVSTVIRVLEKKGFVDHKAYGNTHVYYPLISKQEYLKGFLGGLIGKYFNGSFSSLASFFAKENNMSLEELNTIMEEVKSELNEDDNE